MAVTRQGKDIHVYAKTTQVTPPSLYTSFLRAFLFPVISYHSLQKNIMDKEDVGMGLLAWSLYVLPCLVTAMPYLYSFCGFGTAIPTSLGNVSHTCIA